MWNPPGSNVVGSLPGLINTDRQESVISVTGPVVDGSPRQTMDGTHSGHGLGRQDPYMASPCQCGLSLGILTELHSIQWKSEKLALDALLCLADKAMKSVESMANCAQCPKFSASKFLWIGSISILQQAVLVYKTVAMMARSSDLLEPKELSIKLGESDVQDLELQLELVICMVDLELQNIVNLVHRMRLWADEIREMNDRQNLPLMALLDSVHSSVSFLQRSI